MNSKGGSILISGMRKKRKILRHTIRATGALQPGKFIRLRSLGLSSSIRLITRFTKRSVWVAVRHGETSLDSQAWSAPTLLDPERHTHSARFQKLQEHSALAGFCFSNCHHDLGPTVVAALCAEEKPQTINAKHSSERNDWQQDDRCHDSLNSGPWPALQHLPTRQG